MSARPRAQAAQLNRGALGSAIGSMHTGRSTRRRRLCIAVTVLVASYACTVPTLNPKALGCYTVTTEGWSTQAAHVTGLSAIPSTLALDSVFVTDGGRRVVVPTEWQFQGAHRNIAVWDNVLPDWRRLDDSVVFVPGGTAFHQLAGDSVVVRWLGWGGGLTAYLAPTATGYRGLGQLSPRQLARGAPTVVVELRRSSCASA